MKHRILKSKTVEEMLTPQTGNLVTGFTPGNQWVLGWCFIRQPQGVTRLLSPGSYGHGGAWGTQGWIDPQRKLIFVLMIQRQGFGNSDGSNVRDAFTEAALTAYRGVKVEGAEICAVSRRHASCASFPRGRENGPVVRSRWSSFGIHRRRKELALWLDSAEKQPTNGKPRSISAGRFDIGPELVTPSHPTLWSGAWTAEITGPRRARLTSQRDPATGIQLLRDFTLSDLSQSLSRNGRKQGAV